MKTPVTRKAIQQHWNYSWWKYLLLAAGCLFAWNLFFTTTAYRPPAEKKVDFYVCGGVQDEIDAYMENVRLNEMYDMEQMSSVVLMSDDYYSNMQLTTYIYASEGDVYLLGAKEFQSFAEAGAFLPLEDREMVTAAAENADITVDRGWRTCTDTGERHLYGIPATKLTGLNAFSIGVKDMYLCVLYNNGNDENSLKFLSILIRDMAEPAAETASDTDLAT